MSLTVAGIVTFGATAFAFVASPGSLLTVVTPSPFGSPPVAVKSPAPVTFVFSCSSRAMSARVTAALPAERWSASTLAGVVSPPIAGPMPAPSAGPKAAAAGAAATCAGADVGSGADCRSPSTGRPYSDGAGGYNASP